MSVDGLVARGWMTEHGYFVGGEGGMSDAFDLVIEFSVHAGARLADEGAMSQIYL